MSEFKVGDGFMSEIFVGGRALDLLAEIKQIQFEHQLEPIKELEQRIEKLEKEVFKPIEKTKPSLLTEDERVILRNLDKDFKFIARNTNGDLNVFEKCPKKREYFYSSFDWSLGGGSQSLDIFPNLFQFIKNTDEPYNIEELLKGESEE